MHIPAKNKPLIIGVFGSNGKTSTVSLLYYLLNDAGLGIEVINDKNLSSHIKNMTNIEVFKQLKNSSNNDIIIVEINKNILKDPFIQEIFFDLLIHCHISEDSYENTVEGLDKINFIANAGKKAKTLILNTDDIRWKDIIVDLENTYLITYGLGNKATVTASSIELDREIQFCYCLQRSLTSYTDKIIEPMELPVVVNVFGQYNVYNSLAAITAALVCGMDMDTVRSSLNKCNVTNTGLKILYENGFVVIDNTCNNTAGFETGFEAVQYMPYDNIYLVLDDNHNKDKGGRLIELITTWSITLKIKKIYCLTKFYDIESSDFINALSDSLCDNGTAVESVEESLTNVEGIINGLRDKDMLLLFCSSVLNYIREKIVEILDNGY